MRSVAGAIGCGVFSCWGLFLSCDVVANEQPYLLNCRLMDQSDQLYKRYCAGEKTAGKIVCQGDYCLIVVTNYGSRFGDTSEFSLAIGDGPASRETQQAVSASPAPTKGPVTPGPQRPTPGPVQQ